MKAIVIIKDELIATVYPLSNTKRAYCQIVIRGNTLVTKSLQTKRLFIFRLNVHEKSILYLIGIF